MQPESNQDVTTRAIAPVSREIRKGKRNVGSRWEKWNRRIAEDGEDRLVELQKEILSVFPPLIEPLEEGEGGPGRRADSGWGVCAATPTYTTLKRHHSRRGKKSGKRSRGPSFQGGGGDERQGAGFTNQNESESIIDQESGEKNPD